MNPLASLSARTVRSRALTLLVVVLGAVVIVAATHDLGYLMTWPLSGDESWVVIAKLFPITDLPSLSSSAPVGWNLLVQAFGAFGLTGGRIVTELFAAASVAAAFYAGRLSAVRPTNVPAFVTGIVAALTIALTPATLIRVDIKHYSADAFVAIAVLYIVLRYRSTPTRVGLVWLTIVSAVGLLFAFATLFAAIAAYGALLVDALIRRQRVRPIIISGGIAAAGMLACYLVFSSHGDIAALRAFWSPQYPASMVSLPHFVASRFIEVDQLTAFSSVFAIVPLVMLALVLAIRRREWAFALYLPLMFAVMCVLGLAQRYPLLDARTSNFFLVATSFYAGTGALWLVAALMSRLARVKALSRLGLSRATAPIASGLVALVLLLLAIPSLWAHPLPYYDTSHQAAYVEQHMGPDDLVLFNELASYQLALTWTLDRASWCPDPTAWTGYYLCYPGSSRIVGFGSLHQAYALIDAHLAAHPGSRVWLIRSNVFVEYEPMEKYLFAHYRYAVIDLPIQPVGVVTGRL